VALVSIPGKVTFDPSRREWGFLMYDDVAAQNLFVSIPALTVQHIRNTPVLDAGPEDAKAIEDRRADLEEAASRKFDRGQFEPSALHSPLRIIEISPADLDE
jgi:hypothetical protein